MAGKGHALVFQLFGHIPRPGPGNFDPRLGEDGTGGADESNVDDGVERISDCSVQVTDAPPKHLVSGQGNYPGTVMIASG